MKKRVLITGANGFVGAHLVAYCAAKGYSVDAAVRPGADLALLRKLAEGQYALVSPPYADPVALTGFLQQSAYDYVVHVAGATKAATYADYKKANVDLSLNLARAVVASGCGLKRFVFISSLAAVGALQFESERSLGADSPAAPVTSYGKSKLEAELALRQVVGLPLTIIRPTAVYGPGDKDLFIVFRLLSRGWNFRLGSKPQLLSFVYVTDLVTAIEAAMRTVETEGQLIFTVSDGGEYDRNALAWSYTRATGRRPINITLPLGLVRMVAVCNEVLSRITGVNPALNAEKVNELTAENWRCEVESIKNTLGYHPEYMLDRGVKETIEWYQREKWI